MILLLDLVFRLQILRRIKKHKLSKWFLGEESEDHSNFGILAIQQRLEDGMYSTPHAFSKDVKKVSILTANRYKYKNTAVPLLFQHCTHHNLIH
jgi:hypothetical protein